MLAYHDLLMPPTYLDEYRRKKADQSRSQQSTATPPNADSTLTNDQAGAPADGVRPVRYVASRLTGLVDDQAPIGPDEPSDPYMDALIDDAHRGAQDESNGTSQTAGVASPHPDAGSSEAGPRNYANAHTSAPSTPRNPTVLANDHHQPRLVPPDRRSGHQPPSVRCRGRVTAGATTLSHRPAPPRIRDARLDSA